MGDLKKYTVSGVTSFKGKCGLFIDYVISHKILPLKRRAITEIFMFQICSVLNHLGLTDLYVMNVPLNSP